MATRTPDDRCSLRSLAANEPLAATASTIRRWLLVEHDGPWGRDGLLDARLPEGLGAALRDLERRAGVRVLLVRQPDGDRDRPPGVRCFAVDTEEAWLGSRMLASIEDVLDVDARDRTAFAVDPAGPPLVVVCTHGRRDPCCAEQGRPVAERLRAEFRDLTWESTHVGGDRFAANVVAFPHGLYFGRVEPDEAAEIVRAYAEGRIARLRRYRGRSSDPRHVQAAERALRGELSLERIADVRLVRAVRRGNIAEATFSTLRGDVQVTLERTIGTSLRLTCHAAEEVAPPVWAAVAIERADQPVGA